MKMKTIVTIFCLVMSLSSYAGLSKWWKNEVILPIKKEISRAAESGDEARHPTPVPASPVAEVTVPVVEVPTPVVSSEPTVAKNGILKWEQVGYVLTAEEDFVVGTIVKNRTERRYICRFIFENHYVYGKEIDGTCYSNSGKDLLPQLLKFQIKNAISTSYQLLISTASSSYAFMTVENFANPENQKEYKLYFPEENKNIIISRTPNVGHSVLEIQIHEDVHSGFTYCDEKTENGKVCYMLPTNPYCLFEYGGKCKMELLKEVLVVKKSDEEKEAELNSTDVVINEVNVNILSSLSSESIELAQTVTTIDATKMNEQELKTILFLAPSMPKLKIFIIKMDQAKQVTESLKNLKERLFKIEIQ